MLDVLKNYELGLLPESFPLYVLAVARVHYGTRRQFCALLAENVLTNRPTASVMPEQDDIGIGDVHEFRVLVDPLQGERLILETHGVRGRLRSVVCHPLEHHEPEQAQTVLQ